MADAIDLTTARVLLNESRARRQSPHACQRRYAHTLLAAAACARLRYMADRIIERWPVYILACAVLWVVGVIVIKRAVAKDYIEWEASKVWPDRIISRWWKEWMNPIWGNEQDGVVGVPHNSPSSLSWWKDYVSQVGEQAAAIKWSAFRNPTNNLRFMHHLFPLLGWMNPRTIKPTSIQYRGSLLAPVLSVLETWKLNDPGATPPVVYKRRFAAQVVWQGLYAGARLAIRVRGRGHQIWFGWKLNPGMAVPGWWPEDPCWKGVGFTCGQVRHSS